MQPLYDPEMARPMWEELENIGVTSLRTAAEVDAALSDKSGSLLVVVNSVCGCAAGSARPGVAISLQNDKIPDRLYTVFAGIDREATERAREYIEGVPPSSPSVALFKDGELVYALPRQEIEGRNNVEVSQRLIDAFNEHCTRSGPSVSSDQMHRAFGLK